jgi:UDP-N-acetylmuramoyl-tripeptide--D-alanyl-D-alanine ligase
MPSLLNPFAWAKVFIKNELQIHREYPYDVVVVELGTDYPGNIIKFASYIHSDITVVTALTPEHMEFFRDLEEVADEELSAGVFSSELVVNTDLCPPNYLDVPVPIHSFGTTEAEYTIKKIVTKDTTTSFSVNRDSKQWLNGSLEAVAKSEVYSATAGAVVADLLGVTAAKITNGVAQIQPVSGRMQRLNGIQQSLILDETYNASPDAVMAALDTLYALVAPQKIAILGNMNELGDMSPEAHADVGNYCEPNQLDLVVTIGPDANEYLAPAAAEKGCMVKTFNDPYSAGEFVKKHIQPKAIVLAKGSQNNVYAEEALKPLLANAADVSKLVRQSSQWLKAKQENFKK